MTANPFKPTAGKTPPTIIGREDVIDEFVEGLENGAGAPGRLMRISGVRGTGKTVLLNEIRRIAHDYGWETIDETASEGLCNRILDRAQPTHRVKGADVEPAALGISLGSLQIEHTTPTLRDALARVITQNGHGLLITLDEVQDAEMDEMRALAITVQQLISDDLDIAFVFAGLPSMIDNVINGKTLTFLRRAVPFELGAVGIEEVAVSIRETIEGSGLRVSEEVTQALAQASEGYPFLIQLVGYHAWQLASRREDGIITNETAREGIAIARGRFDQTVIEPALQRVPQTGIAYLLAMAEDGDHSSKTSEVAKRLDKTPQQASPIRATLLRDSLIEAPARGRVSFAIPYMADYLNAHREELEELIG